MTNKIRVSTHDYDTKDINVKLDGNILHVDIGEDKNSVDLSSLIPVHKDFKVTSGSFNPENKSLSLLVTNNSESDEVIIPLEGLLNLIPTVQGERGQNGTNGTNGTNGKSAYELAVQDGFIGTVTDWLRSLKGDKGDTGESVYDIWKKQGNLGTEQDFLNSLKGRDGTDGDSFDCASIATLPVKPWSKAVSLLANDGDGCYRVVAEDGLFVDVAIAFTKSDTNAVLTSGSSSVNKTYIATVSNIGSATANVVSVNFNIPSSNIYTVERVSYNNDVGVEGINNSSNTNWTINRIVAGGSVSFAIDVKFTSVGSLNMSAQVSTLLDDGATNNNIDTLTAYVSTTLQSNYVATVDCPLVQVEDLTLGKTLKTIGLNREFVRQNLGSQPDHIITLTNAYADGNGLAGRRFKITGSSQIFCVSTGMLASAGNGHEGGSSWMLPINTINGFTHHSPEDPHMLGVGNLTSLEGNYKLGLAHTPDFSKCFAGDFQLSISSRWDDPNGYIFDYSSQREGNSDSIANASAISSDKYSFDPQTGILEFGSDFTNDIKERGSSTNVFSLSIYFKPKNPGCNWQVCVILFSSITPDEWKRTTPMISHNNSLSDLSFEYSDRDESLLVVPSQKTYLMNWVDEPLNLQSTAIIPLRQALSQSRIFNFNARVMIKIPTGKTGSFTLTAQDSRLSSIQLQGGISTSYDSDTKTLTVTLNNPQPNDSIKTEFVNFVVEN